MYAGDALVDGQEKKEAPIAMNAAKHHPKQDSSRKGLLLWLLKVGIFGPLLFLVLVIWLDEILDLPHIFFGVPPTPANWIEAASESVLALLAGISVYLIIRYTTRQRAEDEQARKQQKIFSDILIQDTPTLFLAINTDESIIVTSNSFLEKLGYSFRELVGKKFISLFIPEREREEVSRLIATLLTTRTPVRKENHFVSKYGKEYLLEWEPRLAYKENGEVDFIYGPGIDITEQKKVELALRHSEERYRSFIQNLPGVAYQMDIDGKPIFLHGDVENITGYRKEDLLSGVIRVPAIIHSDDIEGIRQCLEKLRTISNYSTELTYRIISKDGRTRWVRDLIQNVCDTAGRPVTIQGMVYDITSTKEAEASLLKSEERYRLLAENVNDVIWAVDKDFRYFYISPSVEKMRGYTVEEAMSLPLKDMFTESSYRNMMEIISWAKTQIDEGEIPEDKRTTTFEAELICKDGSTIWTEVTASYLFDEHGSHVGYIGMTRDITERKRAEESIRHSEETYRTIFESTGTAMFITDKDTIITLANEGFVKLSGYPREEIDGKKSWRDFVVPEDVDRLVQYHALRAKDPETAPRNYDFRFIDRYGTTKDVNVTTTSIPGSTLAVVSLLDISDSKKASEELRISREQLRNLHKHSQDVRERERTRVAREIHDELGQVLTALKMDLSYLAKKLPAELPSLRTKTNLMLRFVDMTIQSVKRITMDLRPGLLDHLGLVAAIEWQADEFQKRTGIRYGITVDPEDIILNPDRSTSVFRIFQETLTNIARHAHATEVKISLLEKDGILEMTVTDNGIGISKEQIENPKAYGLMGIKERAYFSGGQARIYGQKGKGTTVSVFIPLDQMRVLDDTSACC